MSQEVRLAKPKKPRKKYSAEQKAALLDETDKPGESIATVARRHGVASSMLFRWRQLREQGAASGLQADEQTVPVSELKAARAKIRELQRLLGKKTEEIEILNDAIDIAVEKKLISPSSLPRRGGTR